MNIPLIIIFTLSGYLIGSISTSRIVARIVAPDTDLEKVELPDAVHGGTFNLRFVGATTASKVLGPRIGGLIGVLDILKGALPALILRLIFPSEPYFLFAGTAVVIGHIWPIYYHFRGGIGVSSILGVMLVLDPLGILLCVLAAFLIGFFIIRDPGVIFMGGPILFVFWSAFTGGGWLETGLVLVMILVLVIAMVPDYKYQIQAKKAGKSGELLEEVPMGRMMKKMMNKVGLSADKPKPESQEDQPGP